MLSRFVYLLFGTMLLFFNNMLQAESSLNLLSENEINTNSQRMTLHQAINKTFEHNPALRSFSYKLKAQNGRQLQAGLSASPKLSLVVEDTLGTGNFKGVDSAQLTLGIAWILEGEIRQSYLDVARAGSSSLSTLADIKRLDTAAETARLYIIVLAYQARLNNSIKTVMLAKETVSAVNKRVVAGKSPEAELSRSQVELSRQQLEQEDIEHELGSAIRLLASQWGDTQPDFTQVEGDIFSLPNTLSFESLKTQLQQSPEFNRLMSDKHLMQAQLKLAKSQSSSEWHVNLGLRHFNTTNDQALVAGITIPFGERSRNTGAIIEARENLSQIQAKTDELKVRFETTLYVLTQQLQHSLHRVTAFRKLIIPRLEKALKQTRRAYNLGRYSYLEWRSVQAELLEARTSLVEDSIDAHLKVIEIERLTGVRMTQPISK